jgi:nucleoporin NUP42
LRSKVQIKPDRYAALLPANYVDILPPDVKAAFAAEKFEWGKIPEWIPPKEVR